MKKYLRNLFCELFSCCSRALNVMTGGTADLTFSARSHVDKLWTESIIDWIFYVAIREKRHCRIWWEIEVERSRRIVNRGNSAGAVEIYEEGLAP